MPSYQTIIGLEIHIELKTFSKMFCSCSARHFGCQPNTHVCPVCLGLPGALPVPNKKAIDWTVLAGIALGCQASSYSKFDRKNYFYPDLPKGYQISQYDWPLSRQGKLETGKGRLIRIRRVHLEEDTAKLIHQKIEGRKMTLIDFNRAGVPLLEIVTEPDLRSPREAREFLQKLQQIIRYLKISDCDMEKGSMRLEANISLRPKKTQGLPDYKVEIKNLNSFRFLEKALEYEIERQKKILASSQKPKQETRGFSQTKKVTFSQRFKEEEQDYRYFPEPDIPPVRFVLSELKKIEKRIPELPFEKEKRLSSYYGISPSYARFLASTQEKASFFEEAVRQGKKKGLTPLEIAHVMVNKRVCFWRNKRVDYQKLSPAKFVTVLFKKKKRAKVKLPAPKLEIEVKKVIAQNEKAFKDFSSGKKPALEYLLGQVLKETKGRADPRQARELLSRLARLQKRKTQDSS